MGGPFARIDTQASCLPLAAGQVSPGCSEKRNSFDFVIGVAKARTAQDAAAGLTTVSQTDSASDGSSIVEAPGASVSCNRASRHSSASSEVNMFEDIELRDWPVTSQVAAINLDNAVLTAEPQRSSPKHVCQLPKGTGLTRGSTRSPLLPLSTNASNSGGQAGLWEDLMHVLGALKDWDAK